MLAEALAIRKALYDNPRHPYTVNSAHWLATCRLALAGPSPHNPLRQQAAELCAEFGLDFAERERRAAAIVANWSPEADN